MQTGRIIGRRFSERIQLMGRPQIRRQLLDKLSRLVHPVESLQLRRERNLREFLDPLLGLVFGYRIPVGKFLFQASTLGRKLEVVIDDFAEKTRNKAERQK